MKRQSSSRWSGPALWLALGALCATSGAAAQAAPEAQAAEAFGGQKVMRDPATGQLRHAEHDEAQPAAANARSAVSGAQQRRAQTLQRFREMTAVTAPSGARGQRLDTSFLNFSVARRNADGSLTQDCVVGEEAAGTAMSTPASTATKQKEAGHAH